MKAGPKFTYDVSKFDDIINSVVKAKGSLGQVADLNGIPRQTFYHWLRQGDEDHNNGLRTEFVQLSSKIRLTQAEVVVDICNQAFADEKKSRFIMWWLSKICREDFGMEGIEIKELRDIFRVILPLIGKGEGLNGQEAKEVDSSNEDEKGCAA